MIFSSSMRACRALGSFVCTGVSVLLSPTAALTGRGRSGGEGRHPLTFPRFCNLAHVSRSVTVRLKTSLPARESGSTQK